MGDLLSCKRFHWRQLLPVAMALATVLARAEDPVQSGIHRSIRQAGPMARSSGVHSLRPKQSPFKVLQISGDESAPSSTTAEPAAEPALVRIKDSPPPVPPPAPAASPATFSESLIGGVAEVRYISSAWPGTWRPTNCSDIAFQPLGAGVVAALGRQVYNGSVELMTLYDFDFYSADSDRRAELTARGQYQLQKYARRLEFVPAPIKIQIAESDPALDAARRERVVRDLSARGIPNADMLVVLGRVRFGVAGTEAVQTAEGLERVIDSRGRSVTPDTSARFGTGRSFGGFGR